MSKNKFTRSIFCEKGFGGPISWPSHPRNWIGPSPGGLCLMDCFLIWRKGGQRTQPRRGKHFTIGDFYQAEVPGCAWTHWNYG